MPDPHEQAVKAATRTVVRLARLFNRLGSTNHPNGAVLRAYRAARAALGGNLDKPGLVEDVLFTLRVAVEAATRDTLRLANDLGEMQAARELEVYGLPPATGESRMREAAALAAILAVLDGQAAGVRAVQALRTEESLVLGDKERVGVLSPGAVILEVAKWAAVAATVTHGSALLSSLERAGATGDFVRQAVAVLDEWTTQTCRRVHGQVTTLKGDFTLTGTPRFADRMHAPPFHWRCRTSIATIRKSQADDETSRLMREQARDLD